MTIQLWHCHDTRSLRPLWALEEIGLPYDLHMMEFPPRAFHKEYFDVNVLGTVPFMQDGNTTMTESSGICHYLVEKYAAHDLKLDPEHEDYGDYLNWLYHSDATLTFPQTLVLRYGYFEPDERKQPQVEEDYRKWYLGRLRKLDAHLENRQYLCAERFTIADIAVGYALFLGERTGLAEEYTPQVKAYLERLKARPAWQRARSRLATGHIDPTAN